MWVQSLQAARQARNSDVTRAYDRGTHSGFHPGSTASAVSVLRSSDAAACSSATACRQWAGNLDAVSAQLASLPYHLQMHPILVCLSPPHSLSGVALCDPLHARYMCHMRPLAGRSSGMWLGSREAQAEQMEKDWQDYKVLRCVGFRG